MTMRADLTRVRRWLAGTYGGIPGYLSVFCRQSLDNGTERRWHQAFPTDPAGIDAAVAWIRDLETLRPAPVGIYFRVCTLSRDPGPGRRGGADLSHALPGLWADVDYGTVGHALTTCTPGCQETHRHQWYPLPPDMDEARRIIGESGLPEPTLIIASGGGLYPLWLLSEPAIITDANRADIADLSARWQAVIKAAANRLGYEYGDVGDLARVLRIPGTINRKAGRERMCGTAEYNGTAYTLDELRKIAESIEVPEPEKPARARALARGTTPGQQVPQPNHLFQQPGQRTGVSPLDALAEAIDWAELFEPRGLTFAFSHTVDGSPAECWVRRGASSAYSVRAFEWTCINFSTNYTELPVGVPLTKPEVWALWNHGGYDHAAMSAAAKDLINAAGGNPNASPAARSLPPRVLEHIRLRCGITPYRNPIEDLVVSTSGNNAAAGGAADTSVGTAGSGAGGAADTSVGTAGGGAGETPRIILPGDFWDARPVLAHIRRAAHARSRSADAVLGGLLARLASLLPHTIAVDTGVGGDLVSLNFYTAIVGPPGSGKSSSASIPARLLPAPPLLDYRDGLPIGSGEGIAAAYMGDVVVETGRFDRNGDPVTTTEYGQARHNALFYIDEGESLIRLMRERNGSTLGETIRRGWTGDTLGQANAKKETRRIIPAGSYCLGLVVAFQPDSALPLLDEAPLGTPQRFLWVSAIDPSIPDDFVAPPSPLALNLAIFQYGSNRGFGDKPRMSFPTGILRKLHAEDRARQRGQATIEQIDAHKPLMLVKVACLLAILDDRLDVTEEDWELAHVVWGTSCVIRDGLIERGRRLAAAERERQTRLYAEREVRAHEAKVASDVARWIARRVHDAGQSVTRGSLNKRLPSRDRGYLDEALHYAAQREWIGLEGTHVHPGTARPV